MYDKRAKHDFSLSLLLYLYFSLSLPLPSSLSLFGILCIIHRRGFFWFAALKLPHIISIKYLNYFLSNINATSPSLSLYLSLFWLIYGRYFKRFIFDLAKNKIVYLPNKNSTKSISKCRRRCCRGRISWLARLIFRQLNLAIVFKLKH